MKASVVHYFDVLGKTKEHLDERRGIGHDQGADDATCCYTGAKTSFTL